MFVIDDIIVAAAFGAIMNVAMQGMSGNINSTGDYFKYLGIGALAGVVGGYAGQAVGGAVGTIGFGGGALTGAASGAAGGFINGASNAWVDGASFSNGLLQGLANGGIGAVAGGVVGGISSGIEAHSHGGNFWSGRGATYDMLSTTTSTTVEIGEGMEYSNEYAQDFSDKNFGKVRGVRNLYADGRVPSGYRKNGDLVYNSNGNEVNGICIYNGIKQGNDVYLFKSAFVCKEQLYISMGHEYMHASYNSLGLMNYSKQHQAIYYWEKTQGQLLNYNITIPNIYRTNYTIHPIYQKHLIPFTNVVY